jgi:hypothetical protein
MNLATRLPGERALDQCDADRIAAIHNAMTLGVWFLRPSTINPLDQATAAPSPPSGLRHGVGHRGPLKARAGRGYRQPVRLLDVGTDA